MRSKLEGIRAEYEGHMARPVMGVKPLREFRSKHNMSLLLDYSGEAPRSWWRHWPKLMWVEGRKLRSSINPVRMTDWAVRAGHPDMSTVMDIVRDLRRGCDLGTRGENLCPSYSNNAPSAYEYGDRVTDTIVDGIKKGIMIGPMEKEDVPFVEEGVKVNGIMVKLKENGVARVILNLSRGTPFCVNKGMETDGRFEVTMSTTTQWLLSLHSAGRGCWMCKLDWSGAYKQL